MDVWQGLKYTSEMLAQSQHKNSSMFLSVDVALVTWMMTLNKYLTTLFIWNVGYFILFCLLNSNLIVYPFSIFAELYFIVSTLYTYFILCTLSKYIVHST